MSPARSKPLRARRIAAGRSSSTKDREDTAASTAAADAADSRVWSSRHVNWVLPLLFVYVWLFIATPHVRFPILTDIRFERLLVIAAWLVAVAGGYLVLRMAATNWWALAYFGWMLLAFALSNYRDFVFAQEWLDKYWKLVLFQLLVLFSLRTLRDVSAMMHAFAIASGLYQLHSWIDFLAGGSYVFQQGIRRMTGVWSDAGGGAGNAWGVLGLLTLPFSEYCLRRAGSLWVRLVFSGVLVLSLMSILYSGTRSALLGAFVFGVLHLRSRKMLVSGLVVLLVLAGLVSFLPDELQHRYLTILGDDHLDPDNIFDMSAKASAEGRTEGVRDGLLLALNRPIFGYGPGTSMLARVEVNESFRRGEQRLIELHNLYAQILSETGFVGGLIFALLTLVYVRGLVRVHRIARSAGPGPVAERFELIATTLGQLMWILLFYGLFGHTLYKFYWMLLYGLQGAVVTLALSWRRPVPARAASAGRASRISA
ncbi:MAG: hypothetical protein GY716_18870 [bacterium]|nr:hypothetical protein [bacterium]